MSLDDFDSDVAMRMARAVTADEAAAWALLTEARDRAERLLRTPEASAAVERVAAELYLRRELSGAEIDRLLEGALNGQ